MLGLVALASGSSRPGQSLRPPAFDARAASANVLAPMLLVAGVAAAVIAASVHRRVRGPRRPYTWVSFLGDVAAFAIVALLLRLLVWLFRRRPADEPASAIQTPAASPTDMGDLARGVVQGDWRIQVAVALVTAAALAFAGYRVLRRTIREEPVVPPARELAAAVDESIDALRAEPDPRRAVIAAYARMERSLGVAGVPRRDSEAPAEYLSRVLGAMRVSAAPVTTLTLLFLHAKFDRRDVDETMREQAIAALIAIRDDLMVPA